MIIDGVRRLLDLKLGRLSSRGVGEGEEEGVCGTGKLSSLESAAPRCIRVATKQAPTWSLAMHSLVH